MENESQVPKTEVSPDVKLDSEASEPVTSATQTKSGDGTKAAEGGQDMELGNEDESGNNVIAVKLETEANQVRDELATEAPASMLESAPQAEASADPTLPTDPRSKGKRSESASISTPAPAQPPVAPTGTKNNKPASMSVNDRKRALEERVESEPRDGEAWLALIEEAQSRQDIEDTRKLYDRFLEVFPNQGRQWIAYADLELAHSNFPQVEAIFTRCLRSTPSVELWKFYLSYTRRVNPLPPPSGADEDGPREQARRTLEGAYEFALKYIGMDRESGIIWMDYISLIKEREARGGWKEGQKMDDLRRVYQRAVSVPLTNIEAIWKDYDAYENGLNKLTAKKFLAERSPAYMTARRVLRDLKQHTDNLARPILPRIPAWTNTSVSGNAREDAALWEKERAQVEAWKQYLKWEESNPLLIEDLATLQARVLEAYRKATMYMRFYPELWYLASFYLTSVGRQDEAAAWLKNGIEACTGSFMLPFVYVELAEARKSTGDCAGYFDLLLEQIHAKIEARKADLDRQLKEIESEAELARAQAAAKRADEGDGDVDIDGEARELARKVDDERQARKAQCEESARPEVEGLKEAAALVWIKYMHFLRRTEGVRPARTVFGRARKSPHCTWQVFEASALMEYHCSNDAVVATKVFELALKTYGKDEAFVVRYLEFLISINDANNARALFERTIGTFTPERARPIWDRWAEYKYSFGDTAAIQKLESRLAETYPGEPPIKRLVDRNSYMDLDMIGPRDLGFQAAIAGASAADRAVAATKKADEAGAPPRRRTMEEMKRLAGQSQVEDLQGGWAKKEGLSAPPAKRAKFASPTLAALPQKVGGAAAQAGASMQQGPPMGQRPGAGGMPPQRDVFAELPEAVLFFMDILPSSKFFDGPTFKPEDLMECLRHANLPVPQAMGGGSGFGGGGMGRGGFGGGPGPDGGFGGRKPPPPSRGRSRPARGGRMY